MSASSRREWATQMRWAMGLRRVVCSIPDTRSNVRCLDSAPPRYVTDTKEGLERLQLGDGTAPGVVSSLSFFGGKNSKEVGRGPASSSSAMRVTWSGLARLLTLVDPAEVVPSSRTMSSSPK